MHQQLSPHALNSPLAAGRMESGSQRQQAFVTCHGLVGGGLLSTYLLGVLPNSVLDTLQAYLQHTQEIGPIFGPFFLAVSKGSAPKCCVGCAVTRQRLRISATPSREATCCLWACAACYGDVARVIEGS